jgi:hypothetical protein
MFSGPGFSHGFRGSPVFVAATPTSLPSMSLRFGELVG